MNKKMFWSDWLFPTISLVLFATLLGAMVASMDSINVSTLISFSTGLLAYTMMLTVTFIGSRPQYLEKKFGMPEMYEIHAIMSVVLSILIVIHVFIQWNGLQWIDTMSDVSLVGWIGVISLIIVMFTGIFSLSGIYVDNSKFFSKLKGKLNREVNLWLHRFSIVAVVAIYFHLYFLPFLNDNTLFMILLNVYTIATLGYYVFWKFEIFFSRRYKVIDIYRATPTIWTVEFEPVKGTLKEYTPGDYFFIRFKRANITGEGHPFSTSSAITQRYNNSLEFMIKEAGDWTSSLKNIKVGDIATFEGPYGSFLPENVEQSPEEEVPFVLIGGGIGITPILSILRHEVEKNSQREIHCVWGLSFEEDMFLLDEFEEIKKQNPNFHLHIIFSNEKVEGYPHGFITNEYLEEVGADKYTYGHFFVCGPTPMLEATEKVLENGNVSDDQIHLDDFGF